MVPNVNQTHVAEEAGRTGLLMCRADCLALCTQKCVFCKLSIFWDIIAKGILYMNPSAEFGIFFLKRNTGIISKQICMLCSSEIYSFLVVRIVYRS